jgi:hypothetical protein
MSVARLLAVALCAVFGWLASAQAAPVATPYDLYEWGPVDDAGLEALRAGPSDWQVLHQEKRGGRVWLLLALPEGGHPSGLPGGSPSYLARVHEGERIVLAEEHESAAFRVSSGRSVKATPAGRFVFITSQTPDQLAVESSHCFHVVERTQPAPAPMRTGPPAALRTILQRAAPPEGVTPRDQFAVSQIRDRVRLDSLETITRTLSELPSGAVRSRYFARPETETVSRLYIATKLEEALGPGSVSSHSFTVTTEDTTVTVTNVIGKLACGLPNAGAFLITGHYDAIGTRSDGVQLCAEGFRTPGSGCDCAQDSTTVRRDEDCRWNWRTDPAPGADDNATGIAAMLEAARAMKDVAFEFDIYFIAFQAEELGLLGSAAYADSIVTTDQEIFGVFNMDMIGFNSQRNEVDLVTDESSEWFADYIEQTAQIFVPNLQVNRPDIFFPRSDHASFWAVGIDAIDLTEDVDLLYPKYHTFQDTWEATFVRKGSPDQLLFATQLAVSTMARFALHYEDPDFAIPSGELQAVPASGDVPRVETPIRITARMHNLGASSLTYQGVTTDSLTARVSFYDGDPDAGGPMIGEVQRKDIYRAGGVDEFQILWTPPAGAEGFHELHAIVQGLDPGFDLEEVTPTNNRTKVSFFLQSPVDAGPRILSQYTFPNPVRGAREAIALYYELTQDATVQIAIYDLEAQLIGEYSASSLFVDNGNRAGVNTLRGRDFQWKSPEEMASGTYFYTIRVASLEGAPSDEKTGKFALVR